MRLSARALVVGLLIGVASDATAQMPGAPVLQNAWAAPGIVVALNIAGGAGSNVYGGAAGWSPSSGRFQLSGGLGMQSSTGSGSRAVYGARAALPVAQLMGGKLGLAGFVGIGGGASGSKDTLRSSTIVPAGVAIGYRQSIGAGGKGFSVYADPGYHYHSGTSSQGYFRVGFGLDAGISSKFGVTVGGEAGGKGRGTTSANTYGVGLSMKLGR